MPPSKTRTIKNKHAANKAGIASSKSSRSGPVDGVTKSRKPARTSNGKGGIPPSRQVRPVNPLDAARKRKKKRTYSAEELGVPKLNAITPVGVIKPRGKKGKVFVDDRESMATILAIVQAEKDGQIESKMIKARQMEEIREARRAETDRKETDKKGQIEDVKDSLRRKRKRKPSAGRGGVGGGDDGDADVGELASAGTMAKKPKKKVSFG